MSDVTTLTLRPGGRWGWTRWFSSFWGAIWNPEKGEQRAGPTTTGTPSGTSVDDTRAMQIGAVFRCIRIISETAGSLPLIAYRRRGTDREPLPQDHWLPRLINEPNETMTGDEWRESMHAQMAGWGNGYSQIVRQTEGRPVELWPYKPDWMKVDRSADRTLTYQYPDAAGALQKYTSSRVLHLRAFSIDGVMGMSPLAYARRSMGLAASSEDYAGSFFASGGRPTGYMSVEKLLTKEQRGQVRQEFGGMAEGGDGKRFWVLEAGMKYTPISVSPEDMQMLQTRAFQVSDIARFFGVPLFLLMIQENTPNWGLEQQNLSFLTYTLRPYLSRMEASFNRFVIPEKDRGELFVEHDVAPLLKADSKARAEFYSTMVQNGLMTRNEGRRRENMPPVDGADQLTAQVNLAPLANLGHVTDAERTERMRLMTMVPKEPTHAEQ